MEGWRQADIKTSSPLLTDFMRQVKSSSNTVVGGGGCSVVRNGRMEERRSHVGNDDADV